MWDSMSARSGSKYIDVIRCQFDVPNAYLNAHRHLGSTRLEPSIRCRRRVVVLEVLHTHTSTWVRRDWSRIQDTHQRYYKIQSKHYYMTDPSIIIIYEEEVRYDRQT